MELIFRHKKGINSRVQFGVQICKRFKYIPFISIIKNLNLLLVW